MNATLTTSMTVSRHSYRYFYLVKQSVNHLYPFSYRQALLPRRRGKSARILEQDRCLPRAAEVVRGQARVHLLWWTALCNWTSALWPYRSRNHQGKFEFLREHNCYWLIGEKWRVYFLTRLFAFFWVTNGHCLLSLALLGRSVWVLLYDTHKLG